MEPYSRKLKVFSRSLRSNLTEAEQHLWYRLRGKQIYGVQFYRQKPLLSFIADFYCPKAQLVIELDGNQHFEAMHQTRDCDRDDMLASIGLKVLRFDNRQVLTETDAVMGVIFRNVGERLS